MSLYWSAIVVGFLGSFHCIGMCGPIVLAVPAQSFLSKIFYNLGRTLTYAIMGAVIGFIGEGFTFVGWQQNLSVGVGAAMLIIVLFTKYKHFDLPMSGALEKLWIYSKSRLTPLFKSKSLFAPLFIGLINGLLPCGLVYAALFAAVSMGGIWEGALYMALFGLGTAPMLIGVAVFGNLVTPQWRTRFNKSVPYFIGVIAILLILRGLNLGIPMVSPKTDDDGKMMHKHEMSVDYPEAPALMRVEQLS
jgi:sulfite exporter TauE/SafE